VIKGLQNVQQTPPSAPPGGAKLGAIQLGRVVHLRRPATKKRLNVCKKNNVCNRTDIQADFGDATAHAGHVTIRRNGERKNQ
jgi:hypothetical protein